MIRDNTSIQHNIRIIEQAARSGNPDALKDLPNQILDLLDTLNQNPDMVITGHLQSSIVTLQQDKRFLEDQISLLVNKHNEMVELLLELQKENEKLRKIFEFIIQRKEEQGNG